jgi:hypothetical protein
MLDNYSGATRVHLIVGDPIAQVKSPYGVTQALNNTAAMPSASPPTLLRPT